MSVKIVEGQDLPMGTFGGEKGVGISKIHDYPQDRN